METIVRRSKGDVIEAEPSDDRKCYRCESSMGSSRHMKFGSIIRVSETKISIQWEWFCYSCSEDMRRFVKRKEKV